MGEYDSKKRKILRKLDDEGVLVHGALLLLLLKELQEVRADVGRRQHHW